MTAAEAAGSLAWPELMEFVGGPYCGAVLMPYVEQMYAVSTPPHVGGTMPDTFVPVDGDTILLRGPAGLAEYRDSASEDSKWGFTREVNPDLLEPA